MVEYHNGKRVDFKRLIELFNEVGWEDKTKDVNRLERMVQNSQIVLTAWDGDYMIGFARCTTDCVLNGQINNVVVDSRYRNKGVGKALVTNIIESNKCVTYVLRGDPENEDFYNRLGFEVAERTFVYKRRE
jgi:ribosomal protein S18 acetylase RimI-like enzyme